MTPIEPIETPLTPPSSVAAPPTQSPVGPADLTPWGMYLNADPVVKTRADRAAHRLDRHLDHLAREDRRAHRGAAARARRAECAVPRADFGRGRRALADSSNEVRRFVDAAATELKLSAGVVETDGIKERVASRLERLEAAFARRISRGTGVLATIGATAPFVGLFGTVWGIMNSFIGISKSHTTNLAVVAPGIAEALLATAFGLAAAIPAVVIYNVFARQIAGYRALLGDASAEVMRLVSRDLDRPAGAAVPSDAASGGGIDRGGVVTRQLESIRE